MTIYELTYIVSPEITSEEVEAKAREIDSAIQSREGVILKHLNPIAKTLSYQIKKKASGFIGVLEFQLEPEKLLELKELLSKDVKIVRHMLIIKEAAEFKKERRTRTKPTEFEIKPIETEKKSAAFEEASLAPEGREEKPESKAKDIKEKVELRDIEQELDEILG